MRLQRMLRVGPLGTALTVGQLAWILRQHWQAFPTEHRERLQQLLRQAKGNPLNLPEHDRRELRQLVHELNLPRLLRRTAIDTVVLGRRRRP
jgi:ribosomal 50S subunit-associated protein YjgA (DUF615 family)